MTIIAKRETLTAPFSPHGLSVPVRVTSEKLLVLVKPESGIGVALLVGVPHPPVLVASLSASLSIPFASQTVPSFVASSLHYPCCLVSAPLYIVPPVSITKKESFRKDLLLYFNLLELRWLS